MLMKRELILNGIKNIRGSLLNHALPESVYFYTFHKCASTLFSGYVLKNIANLHHIDYAAQIYSGRRDLQKKLVFKKRGFVYGPIRISAVETDTVGRVLVRPTINHNFVRDKIALFFVRDPRDILVSSYYSFGFTHGLSRVSEVRAQQEAERKIIREQTLDEYVLQSVEKQIKYFRILHELASVCERSVILRYEDLINNFEVFSRDILKYLSLSDDVLQSCYEKSRPKMVENRTAHRRSGQIEGFRHKLEESTVEILSSKLSDILMLFNYNA